jgi:hypothetical protein
LYSCASSAVATAGTDNTAASASLAVIPDSLCADIVNPPFTRSILLSDIPDRVAGLNFMTIIHQDNGGRMNPRDPGDYHQGQHPLTVRHSTQTPLCYLYEP